MTVKRLLGRMLQETGQRLQVLGASAMNVDHFRDHFSRHRKTLPTNGRQPSVGSPAWIASTAVVAGDVTLGQRSSVWYGAVVRGEGVNVGKETNIQDQSVVLNSSIGNGVTVGHSAVISNSTIGDSSLIGIKATICDATVEPQAFVASGAVVSEGQTVQSRELWSGNPAKFHRNLTEDEIEYLSTSAREYAELGQQHGKDEPILAKVA